MFWSVYPIRTNYLFWVIFVELPFCHLPPPNTSIRGKDQSRPQSPRYPCPAERENEDLWEDAFELGISLAIDRACAVPPEVDKQ